MRWWSWRSVMGVQAFRRSGLQVFRRSAARAGRVGESASVWVILRHSYGALLFWGDSARGGAELLFDWTAGPGEKLQDFSPVFGGCGFWGGKQAGGGWHCGERDERYHPPPPSSPPPRR